jgi:hypothetical protein
MYQIRLAAGLRPYPLGELTALPRPLAALKGAASRQEWGERGRAWEGGRGRKGRGKGRGGTGTQDPQFSNQIDATALMYLHLNKNGENELSTEISLARTAFLVVDGVGSFSLF